MAGGDACWRRLPGIRRPRLQTPHRWAWCRHRPGRDVDLDPVPAASARRGPAKADHRPFRGRVGRHPRRRDEPGERGRVENDAGPLPAPCVDRASRRMPRPSHDALGLTSIATSNCRSVVSSNARQRDTGVVDHEVEVGRAPAANGFHELSERAGVGDVRARPPRRGGAPRTTQPPRVSAAAWSRSASTAYVPG